MSDSQGTSAPDSALHRARRHLPHWDLAGSLYCVTFRAAKGELVEAARGIVLDHLRRGNEVFYCLVAAVVMPDHVHLILKPRNDLTLSRVMKGIKGVSARLVNQARGSTGAVWQDESWDRIIRDEREFNEALRYVLDNPVKAGLCREHEAYPWLFVNKEAI